MPKSFDELAESLTLIEKYGKNLNETKWRGNEKAH